MVAARTESATALQPRDPEARRRLEIPDRPGIFVPTPQGECHVVVDGDPSASDVVAVCIHGLPGSSRDFRRLGHALQSRGGSCLRLDLPGFGKTPSLPRPLSTPKARADFVADVVRARGLGRRSIVVVGHSFGGTAALTLASSPGSLTIGALALVCSVGTIRHAGLGIPHEVTGALGRLGKVASPTWKTLLDPVVQPAADHLRQVMARLDPRAPILDDDQLADVTAMIAGLDFVALRAATRAVRCPTLVVSGGRDRIVEPRVGEALAGLLSSSGALVTRRLVREGTHFLQRDDAAAIADWIMLAGRR